MKLLPIVPGCKALTLKSCNGHEGKEVKVCHRPHHIQNKPCPFCKLLETHWIIFSEDLNWFYLSCDCSLIRIDGNEDQFRKEVARSQKPRQCVKASLD